MKLFPLAIAFAVMAFPAASQDNRALAQQYVELPTVQKMMDDLFAPEALAGGVLAQLPPGMQVSQDQATRLGETMAKSMASLRPRMVELMITGSAATFSAAELEALIAFYQSEHGAEIMAKMPVLMQSTMQQMAPNIQALQMELGPQIEAILRE